jgi:hypothetical protein
MFGQTGTRAICVADFRHLPNATKLTKLVTTTKSGNFQLTLCDIQDIDADAIKLMRCSTLSYCSDDRGVLWQEEKTIQLVSHTKQFMSVAHRSCDA